MIRRRKECRYCIEERQSISPFDTELGNFISDKGKIASRRTSGLCAKHQRKLTRAIKQARNMGILPYIER